MNSAQPQQQPQTRQAKQSIRRAQANPSAANIVTAISDVHTDLKADVADIRTDVTGLKADVVDIRTDVTGLRQTLQILRPTLPALRQT